MLVNGLKIIIVVVVGICTVSSKVTEGIHKIEGTEKPIVLTCKLFVINIVNCRFLDGLQGSCHQPSPDIKTTRRRHITFQTARWFYLQCLKNSKISTKDVLNKSVMLVNCEQCIRGLHFIVTILLCCLCLCFPLPRC